MSAPAADAPGSRPVVLATYNVRRCIGTDRRHDPDRVAAVLRELDADVVALQEVSSRAGRERGVDQFEYLARAAGLVAVPGPVLSTHRGAYGNAILTRLAITRIDRAELSVGRREPRGALDVELHSEGRPVRVIATHLGLRGRERRQQVRRLLALVDERPAGALALLGDWNEWLPWRHALRPLDARFGRARRARSFPSFRPLLALDRIYAAPEGALRSVRAHASPLARRASDHLPVRATLHLPPAPSGPAAAAHSQGGR